MISPKSLLFIAVFLLSGQSFGQKVGLVLSGGGAKGLAHVVTVDYFRVNDITLNPPVVE